MTTEPLPEAGAEHLTTALRRAGALGDDGRVVTVAVDKAWPTTLSYITRLRLGYEGMAAGAPASLILKTALPERAGNDWGRREVAFYGQVAAATVALLVPRCFASHWDEDAKTWHLLLEDLTDSHFMRRPVAGTADGGAMSSYPLRVGALPCRVVGRSAPRRLDRRLGRRRHHRAVSMALRRAVRHFQRPPRRPPAARAARAL